MLRERLLQVEDRILKACARAGRKREEITLVAVTKVFPVETIREAYMLGLRNFGENYVQEFEQKEPLLTSLQHARFHLIGHLQSNKARIAADLFQVIETMDSPKLVRRLNEALVGKSMNVMMDVMIEVKLSHEESKYGAPPQDIGKLAEEISGCSHLKLTGLMTMPPWNDDSQQTRPYFRRLAVLAAEHKVKHLSMGMSHDFETAIEEGATHIRVGRALFGERKPKP